MMQLNVKIVPVEAVNDSLAQMVALFRVELRSYKGIISKPNIDAGRQELEEYLAAGFPVFAAVVNGAYAGYVVCRDDSEVVWVESIFVREEYRRLGVASVLHSKAEEIALSYRLPKNFDDVWNKEGNFTEVNGDMLIELAIQQVGIDLEQYPYKDVMIGKMK
jgi:GNAT superfamily N-acetyltransferase